MKKRASKKPAKTRRRGPLTKAENQAGWEKSYEPFVRSCRETFEFLIREHGFQQPSVRVVPPECWVVYEQPQHGLSVRVWAEYVDAAGVIIGGAGQTYGLHHLLEDELPGFVAGEPRSLAEWANLLQAHGQRFFAADPALFDRLKLRLLPR